MIDFELAVALVVDRNADVTRLRAAIRWSTSPGSVYGFTYYGNGTRDPITVGVARYSMGAFLTFLQNGAGGGLSHEEAKASIANVQKAIALRALKEFTP